MMDWKSRALENLSPAVTPSCCVRLRSMDSDTVLLQQRGKAGKNGNKIQRKEKSQTRMMHGSACSTRQPPSIAQTPRRADPIAPGPRAWPANAWWVRPRQRPRIAPTRHKSDYAPSMVAVGYALQRPGI